jgi:hypothetical protein
MEGAIVTLASLPTTSFMKNNLQLGGYCIVNLPKNFLKVVELVLMDFL